MSPIARRQHRAYACIPVERSPLLDSNGRESRQTLSGVNARPAPALLTMPRVRCNEVQGSSL
jgi:hypothetical protein